MIWRQQLKRLHRIREMDPVPDELRGWHYYSPPVKPRAYLGLTMSEIAYDYCPTKRDVYLRRVLNQKGSERAQLVFGQSIHKVFSKAINDVRISYVLGKDPYQIVKESYLESEFCPQEISEYCKKVYGNLILFWSSWLAEAKAFYGGDSVGFLPWATEVRVDGSAIGLSDRLAVDALGEFTVVEVKSGKREEFHRLALAGYALAIESVLELPVDYGLLVYINGFPNDVEIRFESYYISPDMRREILDKRDEVIEMILNGRDPGKPVKCPETCPFYEVCWK
ncbi:type I-A CRISPR-associated protein Cas4/Csa1 [Sulfolobus sp. S-194]|uniref:type I-A CRISPR-associated protein Cas4/Csa1 n=1 Tax=Sulfolobus sp. S-194 TaxID=2512240 RepID=UPI001436F505|nr:type I-A CRISPR-associated protein Cas4/Csa1 [Sulfolobus sp. S-194]QIW22812.1 type I-A CRISPR-associated protein Cas4/Csa1 [Sulfolobus sp. S-194]